MDWTLKSYSISAGPHTLKWRYIDGGGDSGDDCGWVDFVQWTGSSPDQAPEDWETIAYKYDVEDRRSEKKINGYSTRYVYDGDQVIAEYDGNNNLLRKYIYGLGVDEPVCMIEVADANATYYYHFDALGSVVALCDSDGDTVQTYEYSIYGEVAVEDANHTNPYMFAGRRYDIEIGLYYNRARYYNPFMGRFLQTDPLGCIDDLNLYKYCKNNPVVYVDPSGETYKPSDLQTMPGVDPLPVIDNNDMRLDDTDKFSSANDWEGYRKCMKKAFDNFNQCLLGEREARERHLEGCGRRYRACIKWCSDKPIVIRELCDEGCAKAVKVCRTVVRNYYRGKILACNIIYSAETDACKSVYLPGLWPRKPWF